MKQIISVLLLTGGAWLGLFDPQSLRGQACQDEEAMVVEYKKGIAELVETTRKESLANFEKTYRQKAGVTKLGLTASMVDGLLDCLDKASQDTSTSKDQVEAYKAKRESYGKLKDKLKADQKSLKAAEDSKAAKALVEKLDYSK